MGEAEAVMQGEGKTPNIAVAVADAGADGGRRTRLEWQSQGSCVQGWPLRWEG